MRACYCKVDTLFYELREPILWTASWLTLRTQLKLQMRPDINVYMTLSSVCDAFYEVVRDRRCRRILRRTLKGLSYFTQQQYSINCDSRPVARIVKTRRQTGRTPLPSPSLPSP